MTDKPTTPLYELLSGRAFARFTAGIDVLSLWRWAKLSLLVGAVVGLAAAGVFYVLEWAEATILLRLSGLEEKGTGDFLLLSGHISGLWWLLLLVPAVGGLCAGLLVWRFAPETRGHGTDAIIDAYHFKKSNIRARVPLVKLVASLFTLGTGGSGGREGPMAQIGAGFGVFVARTLKLTVRERRLLLLAGAAGGISALFRAPLGAALWSLEVLYHDDFESEGLFPALISSVTAYSMFTSIVGTGSLFHVPGAYDFHPSQLIFFAVLGLACAPFGVLWIKMFYGTERRIFGRMPAPPWLKPAIGGLLLGGLGLCVPWVYAGGYGWLQDALRPIGDTARQLPIGYSGALLMLGVAVAKMIATSLTIGSGGSGGVFAPSLFIGGFIGGAFGLFFHELAPGIVDQPWAFVLVGMGAFYAGVGHVPIATIILISELFGSYDLLVPLMFTEMITLLLLRRFTLYEKQVKNALASPAHVADFTVDVLAELRVRDYYTVNRGAKTILESMPVSAFLAHVSATAESFFVVRNIGGDLVGIVSLSNVRGVVTEQEFLDVVLVRDAMWPIQVLSPEDDMRAALEMFLATEYDHMPVVDPTEPNSVLGMLSQQQVIAAYNRELLRRKFDGDGDSEDQIDDGGKLGSSGTLPASAR